MRLVLLTCFCLALCACTPSAWTKTGFSLEQGDQQFQACEQNADNLIPNINFLDFDIDVFIFNNYYDSSRIRNDLEHHLTDEADDYLQDYRQDLIRNEARNCMIQNGWTEIDDPR